MRIDLHIQRLVLDGLPIERRHRAALQSTIETELLRLLAVSELRSDLLSTGTVRSISAGEIQLTNQLSPAGMGGEIARAVHGGIAAVGQKAKQS